MIPSMRVTITTYTFDANAYNKALVDHYEKQMRLAAREFAKTALARIPIRTGFVAGSFGTLTDLVGGGARLSPIVSATRNILRAAKDFFHREGKRKATPQEYYYPPGGRKIAKTPSSGRLFATPADQIFRRDNGALTFNYEVDITYFRVNDTSAGRSPTAPWGAFVAAQLAFLNYMEKVAPQLAPKVEDYITEKKQTVG